jgi:hypothetical protein
MVSFDDVERIALALPQTSERPSHGTRMWRVADKGFVWERPLRKSDHEALGDGAPTGPILGVRTEDLHAKEALLQGNPAALFTTPHFDGYAAVLVALERISLPELEELVVDAWLASAPKRLAESFLQEHSAD